MESDEPMISSIPDILPTPERTNKIYSQPHETSTTRRIMNEVSYESPTAQVEYSMNIPILSLVSRIGRIQNESTNQ